MTGFPKGARFRAAIGLIAAYAIALQALFAAFAPLPANAQASGWHVLCFGSGNAGPADNGDPASPAPASGKFHCVLCGSALAAAAVLPEAAPESAPCHSASIVVFAPAPDGVPGRPSILAGHARAPPLSA